jgi:hypothetical protein
MAKYKITFTETLVYETEVKANNEQDAIEKFYKDPFKNIDMEDPINTHGMEILSIEVE